MPFFEQVEYVARTDVGIRRSHNQDAHAIQRASDEDTWNRQGHVFLVADGMGGHAVGEKASEMAAAAVPMTYIKWVGQEGPARAIDRAIREANQQIHRLGESIPEFRGLGTTCTALVMREDGAWIGHVGDSRVYRIRNGHTEQLSFDHSYVWEMARRLRVPPESIQDVKKNVIVRSLGPDHNVVVDVEGPHPLASGDAYVLCSDGMSNMITPEETGTIVSTLPLEEAADFLIQLSNLRGGPDNITVVIARIGEIEASVSTTAMVRPNAMAMLGRRMWHRWNSVFPWPLTLLTAAVILTMTFLILYLTKSAGANPVGLLAFAALLGSLVGFVLQLREARRARVTVGKVRELRIYRSYPCPVTPTLVKKYFSMAEQLRDFLKEQQMTADWKATKLHLDAAIRARNDSDLLIAFREICRTLKILGIPYLQTRRTKDLSFTPKFDV